MTALPPLCRQVELAIVTYNRAGPLERTLEFLHASPFAGCRISVLDNCSTDQTPAVCERWRDRFPELETLRHSRNLGFTGNYLRAVERSRATYTWVLSDDETYDFSDCGDLVTALREGDVDLFMIGSPHQQEWERGLRTTVPELIARGGHYHHAFTFTAGSIFRTTLFDSRAVSRGYRYGHTLYAHFPFVHDQVIRGSSVYIARAPIVRRSPGAVEDTVGDLMGWMTKWAQACELIDDLDLRRTVIYQSVGDRRAWAVQILIHTLLTRLDHPERLPRYLADLLVACPGEQRLLVAACVPLAFAPRSLLVAVRRMVRRRRGISMATPEFDEFRV